MDAWSTLTAREACGLVKYVQESDGSPYPGFTLVPYFTNTRAFVKHEPLFKPEKAHEVLKGTAVGDIFIFGDLALKELAYQVLIDMDDLEKTKPRPPPPKDCPVPPGFDVQATECPTSIAEHRYSRIWIEVDNCEAVIVTDKDYDIFLFSDDPQMRIRQRGQVFNGKGELVDCEEEPDSYISWVTRWWSKNYYPLGCRYNKSLVKLAECRKFIDILLFLQDKNIVFSEIDPSEMSSTNGNKLREIPLIRVATDYRRVFSGGVTLGDRGTLKTTTEDGTFSLFNLLNPFRSVPEGVHYSMAGMMDYTRPGGDGGFSLGQLGDPRGGADLGTAKVSLSEVKGQIMISTPRSPRPDSKLDHEEREEQLIPQYCHLNVLVELQRIPSDDTDLTKSVDHTAWYPPDTPPPDGLLPADANAVRQILINDATVYLSPCPRCGHLHITMVCFFQHTPSICVTLNTLKEETKEESEDEKEDNIIVTRTTKEKLKMKLLAKKERARVTESLKPKVKGRRIQSKLTKAEGKAQRMKVKRMLLQSKVTKPESTWKYDFETVSVLRLRRKQPSSSLLEVIEVWRCSATLLLDRQHATVFMTIKILKTVSTIEVIPVIMKEKEPTCIIIICPDTFRLPPVTFPVPMPLLEKLEQQSGSSDDSEPSRCSFSFTQHLQAMCRGIASLALDQTIWEIVSFSVTDLPKVAAKQKNI
jgi:hypothetical protein